MPSSSRVCSCNHVVTSVPLSILAHPHPQVTLQGAGRVRSKSHQVTLPALNPLVVETASPHLACGPYMMGQLHNTFRTRCSSFMAVKGAKHQPRCNLRVVAHSPPSVWNVLPSLPTSLCAWCLCITRFSN